ncbi:MAG: M23 family metallopeptidase [Polyangiaceae bacterium]
MKSLRTILALCLVCGASALSVSTLAQRAEPPSHSALALAALDRKIADLDTEESAAKKELSEIGSRIAGSKQRTLVRGRAFYKMTRAGLLPVGGGFDGWISHAMRVERSRRLLVSDIDAERKLRLRAAELAQGLERTSRDRFAMANQRSAMDTARLALEEESKRQVAFDQAFSTSAGSTDFVAVYSGAGAQGGGRESAMGGFTQSRGKLLFPLSGRAEAKPARREGTDGPGLEIRAPLGTPVRAVFAGRVAFADRYGPYGRLVIVDHGEHYYTVSANLASLDVRVGQEVAAGDRLGAVGDDGQGAMLYFEVRHRTEIVAPSPWLGL